MAILVARRKAPYKDDEGEAGLWRPGEIVAVVEDDHTFGAQEVPSAGNFIHLQVTDKTKVEVLAYVQSWNHDPTTEQMAATGDDRTIRVTSTMVSASGGNAFTEARFAQMLSEINADYPTANAAYSAHTSTTYTFTITAPVAARDEIIERVNEAVRDMQYRRRRWYIPAASRDFIVGQGGSFAATAAQIASGNHLRDGLLD